MKQWIKRLVPCHLAPLTSQILVPSDSVEEALRVWDEPLFQQALDRVTHSNRQIPYVHVVMLTNNKLPYTRLCLESLYRYTEYPHFRVIVVDNASTDGTRAYLEGLQSFIPNIEVILNGRNEGFARANNQGILHAWGEYIILLNNDTIVTPGWLPRLIEHLEADRRVGMVGPVTNSAGNEQMIPAAYANLEELEAFAQQRSITHKGQSFEIGMLAMFCVAMPRKIIEQVGLLDERFELGTFEDDDFCHRVKLLGYKLICAEDVFVHHFGRGSTRDWDDRAYLKLFEHNRSLFERKWSVRWWPARLRV